MSKKSLIIFIFLVLMNRIMDTAGMLKYILILIPSVLYFLYKGRGRLKVKMLIILLPTLGYLSYGSLIGFIKNVEMYEMLRQSLLMLVPGIVAIFICNKNLDINRIIDLYFWSICIEIFLTIPRITSGDLLESQYAFIMGAYSLYYFKNNKKKGIFSIILTILCNKRIVLLALGLTFLISFAIKPYCKKDFNYQKFKKICVLGFFIFLCFSLMYLIFIHNGILSEFTRSNRINTQGRIEAWDSFKSYYSVNIFFEGQGIGSVSQILLSNKMVSRLHNDILVFFIELGYSGYLIYIYLYYIMTKKIVRYTVSNNYTYEDICIPIMLIFYTLMLYFTDNVSVYMTYFLPLNIILLKYLFSENHRVNLLR